MSSITVDITENQNPPSESWQRQVLEAVRGIRYGSVEIVVHDGRIVQIERREKVRFDEAGRRRPDHRGRGNDGNRRTDRTIGGSDPESEERDR